MDYNAYEILGLPSFATREEVDARYRELREKYQRDRFLTGLAGEEASEKLQQIEVAYRDIVMEMEDKQAEVNSDGGNDYKTIQELVKNGNLDRAQELLDEITVRDGEWHYVQSLIFYKRNWFLESKKQLEFAVQLEPNNARYKESLQKLTKILASNTISPDQMRTTSTPTGGSHIGAGNGTCTGSSCGDCLLANACCDCLQCMGGCH